MTLLRHPFAHTRCILHPWVYWKCSWGTPLVPTCAHEAHSWRLWVHWDHLKSRPLGPMSMPNYHPWVCFSHTSTCLVHHSCQYPFKPMHAWHSNNSCLVPKGPWPNAHPQGTPFSPTSTFYKYQWNPWESWRINTMLPLFSRSPTRFSIIIHNLPKVPTIFSSRIHENTHFVQVEIYM